jgi:hypothetical protein
VAQLISFEQFRISTLTKLDGVECPRHGQRPQVQFLGSTLRDVAINVRCCCDDLSSMANRALAAATEASPAS